jgi:hypothetical protein
MTDVWVIDLPDSQKIVLLALADCANDEGHCWPSMATLAKKCSKGERTVQGVIKDLVKAGHLTRNEVLGKGCNYYVHPRRECTPADTAPPQRAAQTPAAAADKPSRTINVVKAKASTTIRAKPFPKPDGVEQNIWNDFLDLRKAKRAPLSNTALAGIEREALKAGWSLNDALAESVARGWQSFKADWVKEKQNGNLGRNKGGIFGAMGATERAARQALHEISGGVGRFDGGGAEVASSHIAGDDRTVDALPGSYRAIGYAGG